MAFQPLAPPLDELRLVAHHAIGVELPQQTVRAPLLVHLLVAQHTPGGVELALHGGHRLGAKRRLAIDNDHQRQRCSEP